MAASSAPTATPPPHTEISAANAMALDEAWVTKFTDIVAPYIPASSAQNPTDSSMPDAVPSGGPASSTQAPMDSSMPDAVPSG
eukprot:1504252-Prorocentrum_lima.AAC.1